MAYIIVTDRFGLDVLPAPSNGAICTIVELREVDVPHVNKMLKAAGSRGHNAISSDSASSAIREHLTELSAGRLRVHSMSYSDVLILCEFESERLKLRMITVIERFPPIDPVRISQGDH